jgi:hypothetical protein
VSGSRLLPLQERALGVPVRVDTVVVSRTSGTGLVAVRVTGRIETRSA